MELARPKLTPTDAAALGVLAVASVAVLYGLRHVYDSWVFILPAGFCVLVASATSLGLARLRCPPGLALLVSSAIFVVVGAALVEGSVSPRDIVAFPGTLTEAWRLMLDVTPPLAPSGATLAVPVMSGWITATIGAELALRTRGLVLPLVGPCSMLVVVVLFGVTDPVAVQRTGAVLFALAVLFVLIRARHAPGSVRTGISSRIILVIALVGATLAAPAVASNLPFGTSQERVTLRETYEPAFDPQKLASPLSLIKESLVDPTRDDQLFTITGPSIERIRLAVLTEYDGVVFTMASRDKTAFRSVSNMLPTVAGEPDSGPVNTYRITIDELAGPWLPVPGSPVAVRTAGRFPQSELRFDPTDANLLSRAELASGQSYEVDVRVIDTASAGGPPPVFVTSTDTVAVLGDIGASIVGDALDSTTRLERLRAWFTLNGFYDPGTRSGHTLDRLLDFTSEPELFGYDEQYAATFALLGQSVGLDVRVVVGYEIDHAAGETTTVRRSDMHAWNEVRVDGAGWQTIDIVPRQPKSADDEIVAAEQDAGRLPVPPPIAEVSVATTIPQLDDEPEPEETPPVVADGFAVTPVVVAAATSGTLILLVMAVVAGVVLLKRRRRRRRFRAASTHAQISGAWDELVDCGVDYGSAPVNGATITERAAKISADLSIEGTQVATLVLATELASFDAQAPSIDEVVQAWAELERLEQLISAGHTLRQRVWSVVRPASLRRPSPKPGSTKPKKPRRRSA